MNQYVFEYVITGLLKTSKPWPLTQEITKPILWNWSPKSRRQSWTAASGTASASWNRRRAVFTNWMRLYRGSTRTMFKARFPMSALWKWAPAMRKNRKVWKVRCLSWKSWSLPKRKIPSMLTGFLPLWESTPCERADHRNYPGVRRENLCASVKAHRRAEGPAHSNRMELHKRVYTANHYRHRKIGIASKYIKPCQFFSRIENS